MKFFAMNKTFLTIMLAFAAGFLFQGNVLAQNKEMTMLERAAKEADRLAELLDLDDWQVFKVDSTLQNDYTAFEAEIQSLKDAKVENSNLYIRVQDKWMEQIYNSYKGFFNEAQWAKYLKSGAAREAKARAKRRKAYGEE